MKNALSRILFVLDSGEKKKAYILTVFVLINVLLEMLGIGLLIPILTLLTDADTGSVFFEKVKFYFPNLENFNKIDLIFLSLGSIFVVYFLKTIFLSYTTWYQSSFLFSLNANVAKKLFNTYLYQDYTFHLKTNSARLVQNINNEVSSFILQFFLSFITLTTETLIIIGISILLMMIDLKVFLSILVLFGVPSFLYILFTKKRIKDMGSNRLIHQTLSVKHIQQGLRNIKDLKVLGKEKEFFDYFKFHIENFTKTDGKIFFLKNIPRFALEFIAVTSLVIAISFLLKSDYEVSNILVIVGIFAAASLKILPGVNRITNLYVTMRYGYASFDTIFKDLQLKTQKTYNEKNNTKNKLLFKNNLKLENICYVYPDRKENVLKNINLEIKPNTTIGIIGESGSGKTTFIDLLTGILNPTKGKITVDNKDILLNLREWQNNIGYIPQFIYLIDDSIKKNIAFGIKEENIDNNKINDTLEISQIKNFIEKLPEKIETKIGEFGARLSGGQRQRIGIARALYNSPNLLIMDEATSSLDEDTEKEIMNSIYSMKGKKTIIISTHQKNILKKCDIIFEFKNGEVFLVNNKN